MSADYLTWCEHYHCDPARPESRALYIEYLTCLEALRNGQPRRAASLDDGPEDSPC